MQEIHRLDLNDVNAYLGIQDGSYILFDTGGHIVLDKQFDNRYDLLMELLKGQGCTPENLKLIVLTHGDNDHVANASALRKHFGAKIAMHSGDRALVESPDIEGVMKAFNYRSILYKTAMVFMKKKIAAVMQKTLNNYERFTPDIFLSDGDSLEEYGFDARVLHLPGHTPGSIGILTPAGELIAGDVLTNSTKPGVALNAVDFTSLSTSVDRIKHNSVKTVYPGHGKPFDVYGIIQSL